MKKQTLILIGVAVLLGCFYVYRFTDLFAKKEIQIKFRNLPGRGAPGSIEPVMFYLDKEHPVKSIRVISVEEAGTNKYPHALWHLVAETNTVPVTDFVYGENPAGMKPKIAGVPPEPLLPSGRYRIYIETPKLKGEKEFVPTSAQRR